MSLLDSLRSITKSLTAIGEEWKPLIGNIFTLGLKTKRKQQEMYYGTVFSCVDAIASAVSTSRLRLFKLNKDGEPELQTDSKANELIALLNRPNKFFTGMDLFYAASSHIDLFGGAYWWIRKTSGGRPAEIWPLNPNNLKPIPDPVEFIKGYEYRVNGNSQTFDVEEIIDLRRPNPFNALEGLSTIQMAAYEIDSDLDAIEYNQMFFKNGANPSGIVSFETKPEKEVIDQVIEQVQKKNQGMQNFHKIMVLFGGAKYAQTSLSQKDMDYIEQRKLSRDQIMSIFKVPKAILAISDDVNRANAETQEYSFTKFTVKPRLDFIVEKLSRELLPLFGFDPAYYYLGYDDIVPENRELALKEKEASVRKWKTVNEIRATEGLKPVKNGDDLYVGVGEISLNDYYGDAPEEDPNNPKEDPSEKSLLGKVKEYLAIKQRPHPTKTRSMHKRGDESGDPQKSGVRFSKDKVDQVVTKATKDRLFLLRRRRYLAKQEKYIASKMKQVFLDFAKEIGPTEKDILSDSVEVILSKIVRTDNFKSVTTGLLFKFGMETYQAGYEQTSDGYGYSLDFQQVNQNAVSFLKKRSRETAEDIAQTHLNQSRKILEKLMAENDFTLDKAVAEIRKSIRDDSTYRSERIARTESQTAYNKGNRLAYQQSGVVETLKWIGRDDACEICSQNIGKTAALKGGVWPSGHSEAPVHPNCRCEVIPYFE
jgi:HK97 family phage portal protein